MKQSIIQIPTNKQKVRAFEIQGEVRSEDMHEMAKTMNDAFDKHDKVDMMLLFKPFDGSKGGSSLHLETIKAEFRSLAKVDKYVVVNAPDCANSIIETMGDLIPVNAQTFTIDQINAAWSCIDARPLDPVERVTS